MDTCSDGRRVLTDDLFRQLVIKGVLYVVSHFGEICRLLTTIGTDQGLQRQLLEKWIVLSQQTLLVVNEQDPEKKLILAQAVLQNAGIFQRLDKPKQISEIRVAPKRLWRWSCMFLIAVISVLAVWRFERTELFYT